jgi:hypothetical protein
MDLRSLTKPVSLFVLVLLTGCSDAVQMTHEIENGGVVTYLFKEDRGGPMGSPHRKTAFKLIDEKCPRGYTVVRDGEMRGYGSMSSVEGQEGEITGRHWGIQFRCK